MEPTKVIAVFLNWLQDNPDVFQPKAWQNLPQLEENIADCDDDELFPIAHAISKWCAKHQLADKLKQDALCLDEEAPMKNHLQVLRQSIIERYNALLK